MTDILIDIETSNPIIEKGDFKIGDSDEHEINSLILSTSGQWKESPKSGLSAFQFIHSQNSERRFFRKLKAELRKDKKSKFKVELVDGISDFKVSGDPSERVDQPVDLVDAAFIYTEPSNKNLINKKVREGQNIFNLAIENYGSVEGAYLIFDLNPGVDFHSEIEAGISIVIDLSRVIDQEVVDHFINKIA